MTYRFVFRIFRYILRNFRPVECVMKRVLLLALSVLLSSCFGVDSKITISQNGSGVIVLQYRVSEELQSLGELDGNAGRPPVPAGRIDIERSVERIEGLSLSSYAEKRQGPDRIYSLTLAFTGLDALVAFLNDSLGRASLDRNSLSLSLSAGGALDSGLKALVEEHFSGYDFRLSVQSALGGRTKNFEYAVPIDALLLSEVPVILDIEL
jgi:hypothetical protein